MHITFYNVELGRSMVYQANDPDKGYGVACIACHPKHNVFAYAEKRSAPLIYVRDFPSCNGIITLPEDDNEFTYAEQRKAHIVNIAFTETHYIISVSQAPDCEIIIWDWWTGERMAKAFHDVEELSLQMTCTFTFPIYMAIASKVNSHCNVYVIHMAKKQCYISDIKIAIKFHAVLNDISISPSGTLYAIDGECRIHSYQVHALTGDEGKLMKLEKMHSKRAKKLIRNFIKWTYDGVIVACCDGSITNYDTEKCCQKWKYQNLSLPPYTAFVVGYSKQYCFGINIKGEFVGLSLFGDAKPKLKYRFKIGNLIKDFTPLNPSGRLFATLNDFDELALWRKTNGNAVAHLYVRNANIIAAHPQKPILAVGRKDGKISFIDCDMPFRPVVYHELNLTDKAIDQIEYVFTETTVVRIIALSHSRHFMFLLKELPKNQIIILDLLVFKLPIIDFAPFNNEVSHRLFVYVLIRDKIKYPSAQKMEFFTTNNDEKFVHLESYDLLEPMSSIWMNHYKKELILTSNDAHTFFIYDIHKDELDDNDGHESLHSMAGFTVFSGRWLGKDQLVSYGCDGCLYIDLELDFNVHPPDEVCKARDPHRARYCLRTGPEGDHLCMHSYSPGLGREISFTKDDEDDLTMPFSAREAVCLHRGCDEIDSLFMPHHWMDGGIKKVMIDPVKYCAYSLGHSGNLVCTVIGNLTTAMWEEGHTILWHHRTTTPSFFSAKHALRVITTRHTSLLREPCRLNIQEMLQSFVPVTVLYEAIIPNVYPQMGGDTKGMFRAFSLPETIPEDIVPLKPSFHEEDEEEEEQKPITIPATAKQEMAEEVPTRRMAFMYELAIPVERPSVKPRPIDEDFEENVMKRIAVIFEADIPTDLPQENVRPVVSPAIVTDVVLPRIQDIYKDDFLQQRQDSSQMVTILYETTVPSAEEEEGDLAERRVSFVYETDQNTVSEMLRTFVDEAVRKSTDQNTVSEMLQTFVDEAVRKSTGMTDEGEDGIEGRHSSIDVAHDVLKQMLMKLEDIDEGTSGVSIGPEIESDTKDMPASKEPSQEIEILLQDQSSRISTRRDIVEHSVHERESKKDDKQTDEASENISLTGLYQTPETDEAEMSNVMEAPGTVQPSEGESKLRVILPEQLAPKSALEVGNELQAQDRGTEEHGTEEVASTVPGKVTASDEGILPRILQPGGPSSIAVLEQLYSKLTSEVWHPAEEVARSIMQEILELEIKKQKALVSQHDQLAGASQSGVVSSSELTESEDAEVEQLFQNLISALEALIRQRMGSQGLEAAGEAPETLPSTPWKEDQFLENKGRRMFVFNSSVLRPIFRTLASMDKAQEVTKTLGLSVGDDGLEAVKLDYNPSLSEEEESLMSLAQSEDWLWKDRQVTVVYETVIPEIFEEPGDHIGLKGYPQRRWITSITTLQLLSQMYPKFSEDSIMKMAERLFLIDPNIMPHLGDIWKKAQPIPSESSILGVDCNLSQISITKGLDDPRTLCQRMAIINGSIVPILYQMLSRGDIEDEDHSIASYHGIICQDEFSNIIDIEEEDVELYMERTSMMSMKHDGDNVDELARKITIVYETTIPFEQMKQHMDPDLLQLLADLKHGRPSVSESMILKKRKAFTDDSILPQVIHLIDATDEQPISIQLARLSSLGSECAEPLFEIESDEYMVRRKYKMVTVDDEIIPRILKVLHRNADELEGLKVPVCDYSDTSLPELPETSRPDRKTILVIPRIIMVMDKINQEMKRDPEADPGIAGYGKIAIVENNLITNIFSDLLGTGLKMRKLAVPEERLSASKLLTKSKKGAREGHQRWRKWMKEDDLAELAEKYGMSVTSTTSVTEGEKTKKYRERIELPGVSSQTFWLSYSVSSTESSDSLGAERYPVSESKSGIQEPTEEGMEEYVGPSEPEDTTQHVVLLAETEEEYPEPEEEDLGEEYDVPKIIPKILRKMRTKANEWMNIYGCIGVVAQLDASRLVWRWALTDIALDDPISPLTGKIQWRMSGLMVAMIDNPVMPRILRELYFDAKRATYIEPDEVAEVGVDLLNVMKYRKYKHIPFAALLECHLLPRIFKELLECTKVSRDETALYALCHITPEDDDNDEIKDDDFLRKDRMWTRLDKFPSPWLKKVLGDNITQKTLEILDLGVEGYKRLMRLRRSDQSHRLTVFPEMNELTTAVLQTIQDFQEQPGRDTGRLSYHRPPPYSYLGTMFDKEMKEKPKEARPPSAGLQRTPYPHVFTMMATVLKNIDDAENERERQLLDAAMSGIEGEGLDGRELSEGAFAVDSSFIHDILQNLSSFTSAEGEGVTSVQSIIDEMLRSIRDEEGDDALRVMSSVMNELMRNIGQEKEKRASRMLSKMSVGDSQLTLSRESGMSRRMLVSDNSIISAVEQMLADEGDEEAMRRRRETAGGGRMMIIVDDQIISKVIQILTHDTERPGFSETTLGRSDVDLVTPSSSRFIRRDISDLQLEESFTQEDEFTAEEAEQILEGDDTGPTFQEITSHYWARRRTMLSEELPPNIFELLERIVEEGQIPQIYTDIMESIDAKERAVSLQFAHGAVTKVMSRLSTTEGLADEDEERMGKRLSSIDTARDVLKQMLVKLEAIDEDEISGRTSSIQVIHEAVSDVVQGYQGKKKRIRWEGQEETILEEEEEDLEGGSPSKSASVLESVGQTAKGTRVAAVREDGIPEVLEKLSAEAWRRSSQSVTDGLQQMFEIPEMQDSDSRATSLQNIVMSTVHEVLDRVCAEESTEETTRSMAVVNDTVIPIILETLHDVIRGESDEELHKRTMSSTKYDKTGRKMFIFDSTVLPTILEMSETEGWSIPSSSTAMIRGLEDRDKETPGSKMLIVSDSIMPSLLSVLDRDGLGATTSVISTGSYDEVGAVSSREARIKGISKILPSEAIRNIREEREGRLTIIYETLFPRKFLYLLNELPFQVDKTLVSECKEICECHEQKFVAESSVHRPILLKLMQMFETIGMEDFVLPPFDEIGEDINAPSDEAFISQKDIIVNDALIDITLRGLIENVGDEVSPEELTGKLEKAKMDAGNEEEFFNTSEVFSGEIRESDDDDDDDDMNFFIDFRDEDGNLFVKVKNNDETFHVDVNEEVYLRVSTGRGDKRELREQIGESDSKRADGVNGLLLVDHRGARESRAFGEHDDGSSSTSSTEFEGEVRKKRRSIVFSAIVSEQTQGITSMYEDAATKGQYQSIIDDPVLRFEFLRILSRKADELIATGGHEEAIFEDVVRTYRILRALTDMSRIPNGLLGKTKRKDAIIDDPILRLKILHALSDLSRADVQKRGKKDGIADESVLRAHIFLALQSELQGNITAKRRPFALHDLYRLKKARSWPMIDPEGVKLRRNTIVGDPSLRFQMTDGSLLPRYSLHSYTFNVLEDNIKPEQEEQHTIVRSSFRRGSSSSLSKGKRRLFPHSDDVFLHSKIISKIPKDPSVKPKRAKEDVGIFISSMDIDSDPGIEGSVEVWARDSFWGRFRDLRRHSDRLSQTQSSASGPSQKPSFQLGRKEETMKRSRREHTLPLRMHQRSRSWPRREIKKEQIPEFEHDPVILSEVILRLLSKSEDDLEKTISERRKSHGVSELYRQNPVSYPEVDGKKYSELGEPGRQTEHSDIEKGLAEEKRKSKRCKFETNDEIISSVRKLLSSAGGQQQRALSEDPVLTSRILRAMQRISEGHRTVSRASQNSNRVFEMLINRIVGEDSALRGSNAADPFLVSEMVQKLILSSMEDTQDLRGTDTLVEDALLRPRILRSLSIMSEEDQQLRQRKVTMAGELIERTRIFLDTLEGRVGNIESHDPILRLLILLAHSEKPEDEFNAKELSGGKEAIIEDPVLRTNILLTLLKLSGKQARKQLQWEAVVDDLLLKTKILLSLSKLPEEEGKSRGDCLVEDTVLRAMIIIALSELLPGNLQDRQLCDVISFPHESQIYEDLAHSDVSRFSKDDPDERGVFPDNCGRWEQSEEFSGHSNDRTRILQGLYRMSEGLQKRERRGTNVHEPDLETSILLYLSELPEETHGRMGKKRATIIDDPHVRTRILLALSKLPNENRRLSKKEVSFRKKVFLAFAKDDEEFGVSGKRRSEIYESSRPRSHSWPGNYDTKGGHSRVIYKSPAILKDLIRRFLDSSKQEELKRRRMTFIVDEPFLRTRILEALSRKYVETQKLLHDSWKEMGRLQNTSKEPGLRTSILMAMSEMSDEDLGRRSRRDGVVNDHFMPRRRRRSCSWPAGYSRGKLRRETLTNDPLILSEMIQRLSTGSKIVSQVSYKDLESREREETDADFSFHSTNNFPGSCTVSKEFECGGRTAAVCDESYFTKPFQKVTESDPRGSTPVDDSLFKTRILEEISLMPEENVGTKERNNEDADLRTLLLLSLSKMSEEVYGRKTTTIIDPVLRSRILISLSNEDASARGHHSFDDPDLKEKILKAVTETAEKDLARKERRDAILDDPALRSKILKALSSEEKHDISEFSTSGEKSVVADRKISRRTTSWPGFDYGGRRKRAYSILDPLLSRSIMGTELVETINPSECCALMKSEEKGSDSMFMSELRSVQEGDSRRRRLTSRRRALSWPGDCSKRGPGNNTIPDYRAIRKWMIGALRKPSRGGEIILIDSLLKLGVLQAVLRSLDDEYIPTAFKDNMEKKEASPTKAEEQPVEVLYRTSRHTVLDIFGPGALAQKMFIINDNVMPDILHNLTGSEEIDHKSPPCAGVIVEEQGTKKLMLQDWSPPDTLKQLSQTVLEGSTYSSQRYVARRMTIVLGSVISKILPKITSGAFKQECSSQSKVKKDFDENTSRTRHVELLLGLPQIVNLERKLSDTSTEGEESEAIPTEIPHILQKVKQVYTEKDLPSLASDIASMKDDDQLCILQEVLNKAWQDTVDKFWWINVLGGTVDYRESTTGLQKPETEATPDEGESEQGADKLMAEPISYNSDPRKVLFEWRRKSEYDAALKDKDERAATGTQPIKVILKWKSETFSQKESAPLPTAVEEVTDEKGQEETVPEDSECREVTSKHTDLSSSGALEYILGTTCYDADSDDSVSGLFKAPRFREVIRRPGIIGLEHTCLNDKIKDWLDRIVDSFIDPSELHGYMKYPGNRDPEMDIGYFPNIVASATETIPSISVEPLDEITPRRKSIPPKRITFWDAVIGTVKTSSDSSSTSETSLYGTNSSNPLDKDLSALIHRYSKAPGSEQTPSSSADTSSGSQPKSSDAELFNRLVNYDLDLPRESVLKRRLGFSYDTDPDLEYVPSRKRHYEDEMSGNMPLDLVRPSMVLHRFTDQELNEIHRRMTGVISEFTGEEQETVDQKIMHRYVLPKRPVPTPDIFPAEGVQLLLNIQEKLDETLGFKMKEHLKPKQRTAINLHVRKKKNKRHTAAIEDGNFGIFGGNQVMRWLNVAVILDFLRKGYVGRFPEIDPEVFNMQTMEQRAIVAYVTGRAGCVLPENLTRTMGDRAWMRADEFWGRDQLGLEDNFFPDVPKSIPKIKESFKLTGCLGPAGICSLAGVGKVTKLNLLTEFSNMPTFMPFKAGSVPDRVSIVKGIDNVQQTASAWMMADKYKAIVHDQIVGSEIRLRKMRQLVGEVMLIRFWELNENDDLKLPLYEYDLNTYFRDLDEEWLIGRLSVMNTLLEEDFNEQYAISKLLKTALPDFETTKIPYTIQDSHADAKLIVPSITEPRESISYINEVDRANAIFIQIKLQYRCRTPIHRVIRYCRTLLKSLNILKVQLDLRAITFKTKVPRKVEEEPEWDEDPVPVIETEVITPWANIKAIAERNKRELREISHERYINRIFQPSHSYFLLKKAIHSKGQRRTLLFRQMINENLTIMDTITSLKKYYNETFQVVLKEKIISSIQSQNKGTILVAIMQRLDDFLLPDKLREGVGKVLKHLNPENIDGNPMLRRLFRPYVMEEWDMSHSSTLSFYVNDDLFLSWIQGYIREKKEEQLQIEDELGADRKRKELYHAALADPALEPFLTGLMGPLGKQTVETKLMQDIPVPSILALDDMWGIDEIATFNEYRESVVSQDRDRTTYRSVHIKKFFEVLKNMRLSNELLDHKVFDLWKLKNEVDCSIAAETLRMARYTHFVLETFHEASRIVNMIKQLEVSQKDLDGLKTTVLQLEDDVHKCRTEYLRNVKEGTHIDEVCKQEAMKLKPRAIINYMKSYLKRPSSMVKVLKMESLLHMAYDNFWNEGVSYVTKECLDFYQEFMDLDQFKNAPQDISPELWADLCQSRHFKVMSELKTRIAALEYAEADDALQYYKCLYHLHLYKAFKLKDSIFERTEQWTKRFTSIPIQLTIKPPKNLLQNQKLNFEDIGDVLCLSQHLVANIKSNIKTMKERLRKKRNICSRMRFRLNSCLARQKMAILSIDDFNRQEKILLESLENNRFARLVRNLMEGGTLPWYQPSFSSPSKSLVGLMLRKTEKSLMDSDRYRRLCEKYRKINELLYEETRELSIRTAETTKRVEEHPLYCKPETVQETHERRYLKVLKYDSLMSVDLLARKRTPAGRNSSTSASPKTEIEVEFTLPYINIEKNLFRKYFGTKEAEIGIGDGEDEEIPNIDIRTSSSKKTLIDLETQI